MATESRKKDRIFFSQKEASAGTPNTTCFFEGYGLMTKPEAEYQIETDKGKLGTGEHGTRGEIQAVWTPWTYTCDRLSEIAYMLSYFQGRDYTVSTSGDLEIHQLLALPVQSRVLPTFSFEYGTGGTGNNTVYSRAMVNEFSITFANGDNGVVEATFSGFANRHRVVANEIAVNAAGNMSSGLFDLSSEPLVNYKCARFWAANSADFIRIPSVDFGGPDLGAGLQDITTYIDSCTITGNNGMTISDMARAGGCGVINNNDRGDPVYTLELVQRKDNSNALDSDTLILADTTKAFEVEFRGPYISGTDPYAIEWLFPNVQLQSGAEDDGTPIAKTIPFDVFQDTNKDACNIFVQSEVSNSYNG